MTLQEAKSEFENRFYHWGVSEYEKEINNGFPNLRLFKSGRAWQTYQFMQQLDKSDQMVLACCSGTFPNDAMETLGETCSPKEESLRWRCNNFFRIREQYNTAKQIEKKGAIADFRVLFRRFCPDAIKLLDGAGWEDEKSLWSRFEALFQSIPPTLEEQLAIKKAAGEKIKLATKLKLRKAVVSKFIEAFGSQCIAIKIDEAWPDPLFKMKCCGWIIITQLIFGRSQGLVYYRHSIESESRIKHPENPEITGSAITLSPGVAWLASRWEDVMNGDVEAVSNAVVKHIGFFIEAAPRLLKGLELEKITLK